MSHKFHKTSGNVSGMPSRVSSGLWDKLKKRAHRVWEIHQGESGPEVVRNAPETVLDTYSPRRASDMERPSKEEIGAGDFVLVFMGGSRVAARVLEDNGGLYKLSTHEGIVDDVPRELIKKADPGAAPLPQRTITRDDIPVRDPRQMGNSPAPTNLTQEQMMQVEAIKRAVQNSPYGRAGFRLSPSDILVVTQDKQGQVMLEMYHTSTSRANKQFYNTIEQMIQSQWFKSYPQGIDQHIMAEDDLNSIVKSVGG